MSPRLAALAFSVIAFATAVTVPASAAGSPAPAKLLGPVLSQVENETTTLIRDGGFSVPLPDGSDFWVFADTPRYEFHENQWKISGIITGSTAGMAGFTSGEPLTNRLNEVRPGSALRSTNQPAQFMPTPRAYLPNGSGRRCRTPTGGARAFSVRWPVGAALMPDRTNILVPYAIVCVLNVRNYRAEGWGFAVFDYTKQKFSVGTTDVVRARRSGAAIPSIQLFGSPVVVGRNVTFYSWTCCSATSGVYATTVNASATALKKRASYVPKRLPAVPMTYDLHVGARSKTHGKFSMYVLGSPKGQYSLYASSSPTGPWSPVGSGVLPRCNRATPCHSVALHPELSPAGRLIVSYHLPGYGPGVATKHPYPHDPLSHVVVASLPCSC